MPDLCDTGSIGWPRQIQGYAPSAQDPANAREDPAIATTTDEGNATIRAIIADRSIAVE